MAEFLDIVGIVVKKTYGGYGDEFIRFDFKESSLRYLYYDAGDIAFEVPPDFVAEVESPDFLILAISNLAIGMPSVMPLIDVPTSLVDRVDLFLVQHCGSISDDYYSIDTNSYSFFVINEVNKEIDISVPRELEDIVLNVKLNHLNSKHYEESNEHFFDRTIYDYTSDTDAFYENETLYNSVVLSNKSLEEDLRGAVGVFARFKKVEDIGGDPKHFILRGLYLTDMMPAEDDVFEIPMDGILGITHNAYGSWAQLVSTLAVTSVIPLQSTYVDSTHLIQSRAYLLNWKSSLDKYCYDCPFYDFWVKYPQFEVFISKVGQVEPYSFDFIEVTEQTCLRLSVNSLVFREIVEDFAIIRGKPCPAPEPDKSIAETELKYKVVGKFFICFGKVGENPEIRQEIDLNWELPFMDFSLIELGTTLVSGELYQIWVEGDVSLENLYIQPTGTITFFDVCSNKILVKLK